MDTKWRLKVHYGIIFIFFHLPEIHRRGTVNMELISHSPNRVWQNKPELNSELTRPFQIPFYSKNHQIIIL